MPIMIGDTNYTTFEDIWNDSILAPDEKASIRQKVKRVGKLIESKEKPLPDKISRKQNKI